MSPFISSIIPIVVVTLTPIFAAIIYVFQKKYEEKNKKKSEIQDKYENYLYNTLSYSQDQGNFQKIENYNNSQISLRLYANKEVLDQAKILEGHLSNVSRVKDPNGVAAILFVQMRNHIRDKPDISSEEMRNLLPFNIN